MPLESMKRYRALLARQPDFAETHYRLATLLRKAGEYDEAYGHFISARDGDGYPMRCLTAWQEVYREVASRHDCIYIDSQAYFHTIGRNGLLDDELFQDAAHPSLRGQIALRRRSWARSSHGERLVGRRIHRFRSSILPSVLRISVWDERRGNTPLAGKAGSMPW